MGEFDKISFTAVSVACLRAQFTNMPYTKEIFKQVENPKHIPFYLKVPRPFNHFARYFSHSLESVAGLEARYLSINDVLEDLDDNWNIIEIAAGLSPRSLEWSDKSCSYFETDLNDMLDAKKKIYCEILKDQELEPQQHHVFNSLNVVDKKEWEILGKIYFSRNRSKIAIINEGLLGYFTLEEKAKLRDNLRYFFKTYASEGLWITPDFSITSTPKDSWIARHYKKNIQRNSERTFHRFNSHEEVISFLYEGGFDANFHPNDKILSKLTCIPKMHLKKERIQQILIEHQACIARLIH